MRKVFLFGPSALVWKYTGGWRTLTIRLAFKLLLSAEASPIVTGPNYKALGPNKGTLRVQLK